MFEQFEVWIFLFFFFLGIPGTLILVVVISEFGDTPAKRTARATEKMLANQRRILGIKKKQSSILPSLLIWMIIGIIIWACH